MSEFQADTLRRLIEAYADAARAAGRAESGPLLRHTTALHALETARERLDAVLKLCTKGRT